MPRFPARGTSSKTTSESFRRRAADHGDSAYPSDSATAARLALSTTEQSTLKTFRKFRVAPGVLLCFHGNELKQRQEALTELTTKGLVVTERFPGAYSLTERGYAVMISGMQNTALQ